MTDKETLILAAKAIDSAPYYFDEVHCGWHTRQGINYNWNPLTSNDDCFRLETALSINIVWLDVLGCVHADLDLGNNFFRGIEYFTDHNGDKDKARRYASTRAAALRGRE